MWNTATLALSSGLTTRTDCPDGAVSFNIPVLFDILEWPDS